MKIVYITAGAAGMYCGSCLHDNTLVAALLGKGHEALLVPTYTPILTDEVDVSQERIFFGGINVYLQQKLNLFRHTPWCIDRLLDHPFLLRLASRFAAKTEAEKLGDLTISVLKGDHGYQRKEIYKLVQWLANEVRPELVNLTNVLLSGMIHEIKERVRVPVICTLQGDDIFLEALPAKFRDQALELVKHHCKAVDGFIATSAYYADFMSEYLSIPRTKIHVVYPGLNLIGHGGHRQDDNGKNFTVGYFARICPEKGLHILADAYRILSQGTANSCKLRVSGWLGEMHRTYFNDIHRRIQDSGLGEQWEYLESPGHASKIQFMQSIDVLSVPTTYKEPKGLYVLEALANGVPVVQPRHGSFPELVGVTGGGLLVNPNDPEDLARGLRHLMENPDHRKELGRQGQVVVRQRFDAATMAANTLKIYGMYA